MLQLSITLLFACAALLSLAVVGQVLGRAMGAASQLRRELAECDAIRPTANIRTFGFERRVVVPAQARFTPAAKSRRTATPACALPVAA